MGKSSLVIYSPLITSLFRDLWGSAGPIPVQTQILMNKGGMLQTIPISFMGKFVLKLSLLILTAH